MLGTVLGDVVGSPYEGRRFRVEGDPWSFPLFGPRSRPTDDTIMSFAVARALRETDGDLALLGEACVDAFHLFGDLYPRGGYGRFFSRWLRSGDREPYGSYGNGSAMRVGPAGWAYATLDETLEAARITAAVTHNHPEGVAGAQAVAQVVFMGRSGASKEEIREAVRNRYGYDLNRTVAGIRRAGYSFSSACRDSVPESIVAFLEATGVEDAVRRAVWLNGDTDTMGAMAGAMAEAFHGMPADLRETLILFHLDGFFLRELAAWEKWLAARPAASAGTASR